MKGYGNKLFKSSVFFTWILSYMILIVVTLIITSSVYFLAVDSIERNINKSNMTLLHQMQQKVDTLLNSVENLAFQIVWNSNVNTILYSKTLNEYDIKYINTKVLKDFGSYISTNNWLKSFYVYVRQSNTVYTPDSIYSSDMFYEFKDFPVTKSYEEWIRIMDAKHIREFVPVKSDTGLNNTIAYMQSLPVTGTQLGTLVILVSESYINEIIKGMDKPKDSFFYIIDENSFVITRDEDFESNSLPKYEELNNTDGFQIEKIGGRKLMISHVSSSSYPIKFVLAVPVVSYLGELIKIRRITFIAASLCLIIGGIAAFIFSKRNYIHVSELINILKDYESINEVHGINEYQYIKNAVKNTLEEKKHIAIKLEEHTNRLRNDMLLRLLKGRIPRDESIVDELNRYNISFDTDLFTVILFKIETSSAYFENLEDVERIEHVMLAQFIIRNVVEEMTSKPHKRFMVELDDMMACIINFSSAAGDNNITGENNNDVNSRKRAADNDNDAYYISAEAAEIIKNKFNIDLTISISNINKGFIGISKAYEEALTAMEYKVIYGKGSIIRYSDIIRSENKYYYPPEIERHLINYIKAGDLDKSLELLDEIFKKNLSGNTISIQTAKCLMFNLSSTMIKVLMEIDANDEFLTGDDPIKQLFECQTVHEMKDKMKNLFIDICKYVESKKQSHNISLKKQIEQYILENYHDSNISITSISDVFNMNAMYLSRFFKEQSGQSMTDFINKVRIEKAKMLLRSTQDSLEVIASMTGFTNAVTFIRVFKKYEGITPGKYRETFG